MKCVKNVVEHIVCFYLVNPFVSKGDGLLPVEELPSYTIFVFHSFFLVINSSVRNVCGCVLSFFLETM